MEEERQGMSAKQAEWIDKSEITQLLNRYFRALDEKQFTTEHMRQIFSPDAKIVRPNGTVMIGPEMIGKSHQGSFTRFRSTQHLVRGYDGSIEDDVARVRPNLVAMHLWADGHGDPSSLGNYFLAGGVISAQAVRTSEGWKISSLENQNIWRTGSGFARL
jgi:SnoaL-like domain